MLELYILFQYLSGDFDGRIHWHRYKKCSDNIGGDVFPFLELYVVDSIYKKPTN